MGRTIDYDLNQLFIDALEHLTTNNHKFASLKTMGLGKLKTILQLNELLKKQIEELKAEGKHVSVNDTFAVFDIEVIEHIECLIEDAKESGVKELLQEFCKSLKKVLEKKYIEYKVGSIEFILKE